MGNINVEMPMIRVKDKDGRIVFYYLFQMREDEPKLSYDFKLVEWQSPVISEGGKVITFPWGFQLVIRLEILTETNSSAMNAWQKIFNYYVEGCEIEFIPHYKNQMRWYKVYLSPESERRFYENSFRLVRGVYVMLGKEILKEIPLDY